MSAGPILSLVCAALYATLAAMIAVQARHRINLVLAVCCLTTAAWSGASAVWPGDGLNGPAAGLDMLRALAWFGFLLDLYRRAGTGSTTHGRMFAAAGLAAGTLALVAAVEPAFGFHHAPVLWSLPIAVRLGLAITELLLIENLYLNLPEHTRWHVAVPCVLLGGLACMDILVCTDLVLFHRAAEPLDMTRVVVTMMVAPLLVLAAIRGQRWHGQIRLSRTAVFQSATLILSGAVLLALAAAGQVFRQFGGDWGWVAETSLMFAGLIGVGLAISSRSARSRIHKLIVQHFFADRYDYRRQWLACIDTLSGVAEDGRTPPPTRAIRAMADVVDSPNGVLFLREGGTGAFGWAGSWNMPAATALPPDHGVVAATRGGDWIVDLHRGPAEAASIPPLDQLGRIWLAIPLVHRGTLIGLAMVGPPRVPFRADQETFDLLRTVGREVATYIAEQRATQVMVQTRHLHDYSKRFAFVAHDIKNVSSQLALLLRNAERHISNPAFQQDMLETVGASVTKITALLRRLEAPQADRAPAALTPLPRLEALVATYRRVRQVRLELDHDGSTATVAMGEDAFDTALTHLLNNAVEASAGKPVPPPVQIRVRHEVARVVIDIVDEGCGMSAEFVRDQLFRPFTTRKREGSGIGAFQARELLRESGGELEVVSREGSGTTMRLLLPRTDPPELPVPALAQAVA